MDLVDKSLDLLEQLQNLDIPNDFDLKNLKFGIIELNGTYQNLLKQAKSLEDKDALNVLELYKENRKQLLKEFSSNSYDSDELYF